MLCKTFLSTLLCLTLVSFSVSELAVGLTASSLFLFDTDTPATTFSTVPLSGIVAGQTPRSIDFQPTTGNLYLVSSAVTGASSDVQLYTVSQAGVATPVGAGFSISSSSTGVFIDFNPTVNLIRLVTSDGLNFRVNLAGGIQATDGTLAYNTTDVNAALPLNVQNVAYTNNVLGATTTTLYSVNNNTLITINPPNAGTLNTVGGTGENLNLPVGLDVSGETGNAYASDGLGAIFSVNLATGVFALIGATGVQPLLDFSVVTNTTGYEQVTTSILTTAALTTGLEASTAALTTGLEASTAAVTTGASTPAVTTGASGAVVTSGSSTASVITTSRASTASVTTAAVITTSSASSVVVVAALSVLAAVLAF